MTKYEVLIVDWKLPGLSGPEVCEQASLLLPTAKLLMLTGKSDLMSKVSGFACGCDDYMCKPFDMDELTERVRALLRRSANQSPGKLTHDGLSVLKDSKKVDFKGKPIQLMAKEFEILAVLLSQPETVHSYQALLNSINDEQGSKDALRTYISRLRKRLNDAGCELIIENVAGEGYKIGVAQEQLI
jgi:DNA-binding response OmpR family regulator